MNFRAFALCMLTAAIILSNSCAGDLSRDPVNVQDPSTETTLSGIASDRMTGGHNLLGFWIINIDSETETGSVVPVRSTDLHLNVLKWMETGPCTNCLKITGIEKLPNKDLNVTIEFTHPFTLPNLSGFDVRGIAMFGGGENFSEFGVTASTILEGNPVLLNADGHTTLYNLLTEGNGVFGYMKGKLSNAGSPDATLNGYRCYYSNENRRYFMAGDSIEKDFLISPPEPIFSFGYAVDASWAKPDTPVSVPDSFPMTANSTEAYLIETELSNALPMTMGGNATLTIDIYDWQGAATIDEVMLEGPYLWEGLITATEATGGPGTKRFTAELTNEYGFVDQGEYPILIRITDTNSTLGALIDNTAWKLVNIPVILNHPPVCKAEVSNPEPEAGEVITFTDTSTDAEGPGDLAESWWDWDNTDPYDEEGFEVTHSFDEPGIYVVRHKVIDQAGASDALDEPLQFDVGLFVTLQEDFDTKEIDTVYQYISLNGTYDSGNIINVDDLDGPWDFTDIGLASLANTMTIVDDSDPEVSSFADEFNSNTTHFVKYLDIFDPFFPLLYQAEYHHFGSDNLYIYGYHDPYVIGNSFFGPPATTEYLKIPYPLTINTDYKYTINNPGFNLVYSVKAIGEGEVTVPFDGGQTYDCLLVRYKFNVSSDPPVNGGTLNFAFINDNGIVVANVIAVNKPPGEYNWNTSTNKINYNGNTLFQALHSIE